MNATAFLRLIIQISFMFWADAAWPGIEPG
jgi:hypothetical protein